MTVSPEEPLRETIGFVDAIVLGIVEGLTEFLPVSSTGHLILTNRMLGLVESPTMTIGIQFGAISAILVLYWRRLLHSLRAALRPPPAGQARPPNLLLQIVVAALPAAVLGLLAEDWIEAHLFSPGFVAGTITVGGVLLLVLEGWLRRGRRAETTDLAAMSYRTAFWIGVWQCLALLPGTSRSGATIAGALVLGLSRPAAAEFSFLVGLPILYGACAVKLASDWERVVGPLLMPMVVGTVMAFLSAIAVVVPFVRFLRARTFAPFAVYRIVAGLLVAAACLAGWL